VLPYYRMIENYDGGASELRGSGGPLAPVIFATTTREVPAPRLG
jgi:hypothetical protein